MRLEVGAHQALRVALLEADGRGEVGGSGAAVGGFLGYMSAAA